MLRKELIFILWEDDTKGGGHSAGNQPIEVKSARVQHNGLAVVEFTLTKGLMQKAMKGEAEIVLKSNHLRELGITQFDDLFANESIENLYKYFCEKMDTFILTDNRNQKEGLAENVKQAIGNYLEPSFWRDLKGKPNINRVKQAFQKLLADNEMLQTKAYFIDLLDRIYEQLFYGVVDDDIDI